MTNVKNLKQIGCVQYYLDKFNKNLNNAYLSKEYIVSYFLSGLKEEI